MTKVRISKGKFDGINACADDNGVIAFALTNAGLMASARVDGTRISKLAS